MSAFREIQDRQAAKAERDTGCCVHPASAVVRPPMHERIRHAVREALELLGGEQTTAEDAG